jgi:acyl-CoA synthetase (NDP forming)
VPSYPSPEAAAYALGRVAGYAEWRRTPGGQVPDFPDVDEAAARAAAEDALRRAAAAASAAGTDPAGTALPVANAAPTALPTAGPHPAASTLAPARPAAALPDAAGVVTMAAADAADLLGAYGIELWPERRCADADEAVAVAEKFGYPVALKATDEALRHRVDLGGVRLDVGSAEEVRAAMEGIAARPGFTGAGVLVQPMAPPGVGCVVEVVQDSAFGPVVGFGLAGLATELLGDRAWRAVPLTDLDARALVRAPLAAPMLFGHRGATPVDVAALEELLLRLGALADELPELHGLELNPVLASERGLTVLHAEVRVAPPGPRPDAGPRRLR